MRFIKLREDWVANVECIESITRKGKASCQVVMSSGEREVADMSFESLCQLLSNQRGSEVHQHFAV